MLKNNLGLKKLSLDPKNSPLAKIFFYSCMTLEKVNDQYQLEKAKNKNLKSRINLLQTRHEKLLSDTAKLRKEEEKRQRRRERQREKKRLRNYALSQFIRGRENLKSKPATSTVLGKRPFIPLPSEPVSHLPKIPKLGPMSQPLLGPYPTSNNVSTVQAHNHGVQLNYSAKSSIQKTPYSI